MVLVGFQLGVVAFFQVRLSTLDNLVDDFDIKFVFVCEGLRRIMFCYMNELEVLRLYLNLSSLVHVSLKFIYYMLSL